MPHCPLCHHTETDLFHQDKQRPYFQCQQCALVFVPPSHLPSLAREKQEYDLHQNLDSDLGYQRFLSKLTDPLTEVLAQGATGLDYGCGPNPVLAKMLNSRGFTTRYFDPIYFPATEPLTDRYDFISCSEAIEHFHQPAKEWRHWMTMLRNHGWLGIMTKRVINAQRFAHWHYKNDITHVSFFSSATFDWLAQRDGLTLKYVGDDVVLLQKTA